MAAIVNLDLIHRVVMIRLRYVEFSWHLVYFLFGDNSVMKISAELDGHLVSSEGDLDEDAAKIRLIEILTKMHQKSDVEGFGHQYDISIKN